MDEHQIRLTLQNMAPVPHTMNPLLDPAWKDETFYSDKYEDDVFEFRRVTVPRAMVPFFPQHGRTMNDREWRELGIIMSRGWEHYDIHLPEVNVLLFRRPIGTDGRTGVVPREKMELTRKRISDVKKMEEERWRRVRNME